MVLIPGTEMWLDGIDEFERAMEVISINLSVSCAEKSLIALMMPISAQLTGTSIFQKWLMPLSITD